MALSSGIVWEVRTGGSANNGGGYKTGASGTDFTQQNSAQYALTGCTSSGAGAVILTASAAADMVGNVARVVSGSNFTAGWYEITSVSVGVSITVDANCTIGAGASGVINIGGALAAIGNVGSASANQGMVAGNLMCVKAGTYSLSATDTIACSGTVTSPIRIVGYNSVRPTLTTAGDGYLGRTGANLNKTLDTSNMPNLSYTVNFKPILTGSFISFETIKVSGNQNTTQTTVTIDSVVKSCVFVNANTGALTVGLQINTRCSALDCDAFLTGASGGTSAFATSSGTSGILFFGCHGKTTSTTAAAFSTIGAAIYVNCIGYQSGIGLSLAVAVAGGSRVIGCTFYGNAGDGIKCLTGTTGLGLIANNIITDNGGYGINLIDVNNGFVLYGNRTRNNTSGAINGGTDWVNASNWQSVTTDTGGASSDYLDPINGDFLLIRSSPAAFAGVPRTKSFGAFEAVSPAQGGGFF